MRLLILGGYGVFGGRLARLLSDCAELDLLIAGRDLGKARAFCAAHSGAARMHPLALARRDIAVGLAQHRPDLLVDASGPFQHYDHDGGDRYAVIAACIAAGIDYLDFADAADFVFGVSRFDAQAKQAGVFVLAGVSSFPVLTAAVLREMAQAMEIVSVEGGIAPSPHAGIGLNVMRAVIGYAGAPVKLLRHGIPSHGTGLAESRHYTVAVPGYLPLRNIRFSLVDVPDLQVIPPEHDTMTDIWMGAGPVPELLHRILNLLAKARARLHLPAFVPFSRLFYTVLNLMQVGEHRGGMYVRVEGRRDGAPVEVSWHLLAEGDDGPFIPSMAIECLIRKLLLGERPQPGARPAVRALDLADYDRLFARRTITTGFRTPPPPDATIYQAILGPAFAQLPEMVQQMHATTTAREWRGTATVRRGPGRLSRFVGSLFGFPDAGDAIPLTVGFAPEPGGERWTRRFGERAFHSRIAVGTGRYTHLMVERFGPFAFAIALVLEDDRLHLVPRHWSLFGLPLPRALMPRGTSFETEQAGQYRFDVEIAAPLVGPIVTYRGTLAPVV